MVRTETKSTPFLGGDDKESNRTHTSGKETEIADPGCCGIPVLSWYPSKKKQAMSSTVQKPRKSNNGKHPGDNSSQSFTSNIYKLFSCNTPNFCSCGTCLFCDSSYSTKKVMKGPQVPNSIYTEVVVTEPKPSGFCFGWYGQERPTTQEQVSTKVSPIYKAPALNNGTCQLENLARADSNEVITDGPSRGCVSDAADTSHRKGKRSPVIPWNTEFKGRSVIIEEKDCGELDEGEVLFGQTQIEKASEVKEDESLTADAKQYRLCFVESEADETEDEQEVLSAPAPATDDEDDDLGDGMVEIPLTPYSLGKHSWNGRLELMEELDRAK